MCLGSWLRRELVDVEFWLSLCTECFSFGGGGTMWSSPAERKLFESSRVKRIESGKRKVTNYCILHVTKKWNKFVLAGGLILAVLRFWKYSLFYPTRVFHPLNLGRFEVPKYDRRWGKGYLSFHRVEKWMNEWITTVPPLFRSSRCRRYTSHFFPLSALRLNI